MNINDRVKALMDHETLTSSEFADKAGIQQSTFSHFINGRNKASLDVVTKIHQAFEDVSLEWLLYGQGQMFAEISPGNEHSLPYNGSVLTEKNLDNKTPNVSASSTQDALSALAPLMAQQVRNQAVSTPASPPRKITEIRVFFDDNTYEVFRPGE